MHFIVIQPGPGAAWTRAEVTAGPLLPSSIFGLRKRPSLLTNCLGILSFGFWKTPVSQASQTATGKLPHVPAAPRQLWRRARGERGSGRSSKAALPRAGPCCGRQARIPHCEHFLLRIILFGFRLEQEVLEKKRGTASRGEEKKNNRAERLEAGAERAVPCQPHPLAQAGEI